MWYGMSIKEVTGALFRKTNENFDSFRPRRGILEEHG